MNQDGEAYKSLSYKDKQKWTAYLIACCMVASLASFTFGYNIGVINLPTPLVTAFYSQIYFTKYYEGIVKVQNGTVLLENATMRIVNGYNGKFLTNYTFDEINDIVFAPNMSDPAYPFFKVVDKVNQIKTSIKQLIANNFDITGNENIAKSKNDIANGFNKKFNQNFTFDEIDQVMVQNGSSDERHPFYKLYANLKQLKEKQQELEDGKVKLKEGAEKVGKMESILWTLTTSIFVVGGTIGALTSKYVSEKLGRKNGIIFHYSFAIVAAILSILAPYVNRPECIMIARFLFGVQGGMACGLIPTYLYEVSPSKLRGSTGVIHQLFLTIGIAVSQLLGFRQVLGTADLWHILLGLPIIPCVLGGVLLFIIFPESPSSLIRKYKDDHGALSALKKLRNSSNVEQELDEIRVEISKDSSSGQGVSIANLFQRGEYRWPLITGLVLQITQQLCGINAVFFYSGIIYKDAGITDSNIQYAVCVTGIINVVATILAVSLIDKLGRKPLLLYPMIVIVLDFIVLTILLVFKSSYPTLSYVSIVCIVVFIICFAVGLGPIPFVYVAETFPSEARSTALAICMFTNWMANLLLTMTFIYINSLLREYTFLVFLVIVAIAVVFIFKKVPETKNCTPQEILAKMDPKYAGRFEESRGKLMQGNTSV